MLRERQVSAIAGVSVSGLTGRSSMQMRKSGWLTYVRMADWCGFGSIGHTPRPPMVPEGSRAGTVETKGGLVEG